MKKGLLILIVVLIVLAAIGGILISRSSQENGNGQDGQTVDTITIQFSDGGDKRVKVAHNLPPELELSWKETVWDRFCQVILGGKVKNVSTQLVDYEKIETYLDGERIGLDANYLPLEPGEERGFGGGIIVLPEEMKRVKTVEVRIFGFEKVGAPTSEEPTPTEPDEQETQVFTRAPRNPKSPAEVVAAFAFYCDAGQYDKAKKLCTENFITEYGDLEQLWEHISNGVKLNRVEIISEHEHEGKIQAQVNAVFCFSNGSKITVHPQLKKVGSWKMNF